MSLISFSFLLGINGQCDSGWCMWSHEKQNSEGDRETDGERARQTEIEREKVEDIPRVQSY